ncbi:hybrid sensor histidine kinase/response regulator [Arsenicibacter rosenii]|uniref:histidine kinase n=2 Tax=Arsenicibacter rosenii TaxID=1750698 RepID=A0A1S2VE31_9BACT|nr:hybrid sensor histidine kinase/response regulator [Arsenicibacter rosenii]
MRFVYLFLLIPYMLRAQQMPLMKGWQELTISDGLSQGMVFDIKQDRKGFIWVATKDGLNRYDGYNFQVFTHDPYNEFSLSDDACSALLVDRKGRLWIGTQANGLNLYDDRNGRFYHILIRNKGKATAGNYDIRLLSEDPEGNIWVGTSVGRPFKIVLPETLRQGFPEKADFTDQVRCIAVELANEEPNNVNYSFAFGADGQAITGMQDNVYTFNWKHPAGLKNLNLLEGTKPVVIDLYKDYRKDYLFVSTGNQLISWHNGVKKVIRFPGQGDALDVKIDVFDQTRLAITKGGNLWLFSAGDLFIRDSLTKQDVYASLPPQVFQITKALKDQAGNIWIGTAGYGLRKFNPAVKQFQNVLSGKSLGNLYVDGQGRTYARVLYAYGQIAVQQDKLTPFLDPRLPSADQRQRNMIQSRDGSFWVSNVNFETHENRLFWFSPQWKLLKKYPLPQGVYFGFTGNQTYEDRSGNLWIGATNGNLLCFNRQTEQFTIHHYQHLLQQSGGDVETFAFVSEADSVFWIGTQKGLVKVQHPLHRPVFSMYRNSVTDRQSLSNDFILSLAADPYQPGRFLWIGTKGGGLDRLNRQTGRFEHVNVARGLPNKVVYGILTDEFRNLWLSTNKGISRFNPRTFEFRNYTKADGLQDDEFNTLSYAKNRAGDLLFGGVNGLTIFRPGMLTGQRRQLPKLNIIGLKVNNNPVEPGDDSGILAGTIDHTTELHLAHDQNLLTFEFAVMDYTNVGKNRFRYRLEGIDRDWVEAGTNRFANYAQLPDGHYTLQVTGSADGDVWSEPVTLQVRVHPPFYRTWWAYLFYMVVITVVGLQAYRIQTQRLLLQQQVAFEQQEAGRLAGLDALKTRFFTNISHEFRTPLTLILGPLSNRRHKQPGEAELSMMEHNGRRLLALINQVLDLSKLEAGNMQVETVAVDVASFIRTLTSSYVSLAAGKSIQFEFDRNPAPCWVYADRDKLEKILTNLLSNAFKFTPPGGTVQMEVAWRPENSRLELTVSDTGIGIPAAQLPKIFDRFYQAGNGERRAHGGTGIGLALVQELVTVLKGTVSVTSTEGQGTTFRVMLPLPPAPGSNERPVVSVWPDEALTELACAPSDTTAQAGAASEKILLIIDDNADIRTFLRSVFAGDYVIMEAEDGLQGLQKATEVTPDLVICDLMMPHLDGFGFCRILKTQVATSHIPVVMLTAKATVEDRIEGFGLGADDYLTKPFDATEIRVRVKNLIRQRERLAQYYQSHPGPLPVTVAEPVSEQLILTENNFLEQVQTLVDSNMADSTFDVEQLSRQLNLSPRQLVRKLKTLTGQTTVEFIRNRRLERSAVLIRQGTLSVSEVAFAVGFESLSYFTRSFQEKYGVLPSAYTGDREDIA